MTSHIIQTLKEVLRYIDSILAKVGSTIIATMTDSSRTPRPTTQRQKLFVDCTYIYSTNINTGIQRVVRNIIKHLETHACQREIELVTVALINGALIRVDKESIATFQSHSVWINLLQRIQRKVTLYITSFFKGETVYEEDMLLMLDSSWHLHVWSSIRYAKSRGASVIGVTYDLIPVTHPQFCDNTMERYFREWYRRSIDYFDGYIAISKTVMADLMAFFASHKVPLQHYTFNHFTLGADFDSHPTALEDIREELIALYREKPSVYLTVSTIEPRKNHRFVFETFQKLWANGSRTTWVIVGRAGWKTEALLQEMQKDKAYGDKLWIFNDLSDTELGYCYQHSKALLFASIVEGYGLPIIESLQYALPVLASDTPIHREVGGEGIDYFDIAIPHSLVEIISAIESGERTLKKIDRERVTMPTWDQSAKEMLEKIILISQQSQKKGEPL